MENILLFIKDFELGSKVSSAIVDYEKNVEFCDENTSPDDFVDRDLIVIVAFQQWHQPLVDESIENLEKDKLDLTHNIIEVPTIRKSTKLNEIYLDGVMRRAIKEDRIRNRTITAYIDKEEFKQSLEIPDEQSIYWFLIEKDSRNILLRGSGVITPKEVNLIKSN